MLNVLFLCTHNSARSIMAEALLNKLGKGRFQAFSAGKSPASAPDRLALKSLTKRGIEINGLNSKLWNLYAQPGAPYMDAVISVCDQDLQEACPAWPNAPVVAQWPVFDPVIRRFRPIARRRAIREAFAEIEKRVAVLAAIPFETLDRDELQRRLDALGQTNSFAPIPV